MIFAYVFGKPTERRELSGPGGGAIQQETTHYEELLSTFEVARRLAYALAKGDAAKRELDGMAAPSAEPVPEPQETPDGAPGASEAASVAELPKPGRPAVDSPGGRGAMPQGAQETPAPAAAPRRTPGGGARAIVGT